MKYSLLVALLAGSVSALGLVAWPGRSAVTPPPPGKYTGILTVHRALIREGLETSFTVKVDASVAADGQVTILTATPESPGAAANIENSVVRAAPRPLLTVPVTATIDASATSLVAPVGNVVGGPVLNPSHTLSFSNYLVNGSIPASLTVAPRMVYLSYSLTQYLPIVLTSAPGAINPPVSNLPIVNTLTAPSASPLAPGAVAFPPSNVITLPTAPANSIFQTPNSRVTYDFVLRYQRPAANAVKAPAPAGR